MTCSECSRKATNRDTYLAIELWGEQKIICLPCTRKKFPAWYKALQIFVNANVAEVPRGKSIR